MSKKDRAHKRAARIEAENARREKERVKKESIEMIKRIKKDQFRWQSEKVN